MRTSLIYKIANNVGIEIEKVCTLEKYWKNFQSEDHNIKIIVRRTQMDHFCGVDFFSNFHEKMHLLKINSDLILVDFKWSIGMILQLTSSENLNLFLLQMFYAQAVKQNMILLHSSLIDWKGRGLMFLGPSGIGKTTQAELWNQYRDALIINGDAVFVQETPDAFLGWGTPWHGSSPYCENTSVPVAAMVVLKQAPKNSIRELTGFEKVTEVSNSVFYPQWVEGGMELCLETLDHLLTKIPVYELSCRPDEGAVELVEQVVFGHVQ